MRAPVERSPEAPFFRAQALALSQFTVYCPVATGSIATRGVLLIMENKLFYLAASNSSLFRLQPGPYHICATTKLVLSTMIPVSSVKAHPTPILLDSGSTAAVPPAPNRHRARFKAAVAEAPRLENTSTKYVVITPWIDVAAQPRKKVHITGTEM